MRFPSVLGMSWAVTALCIGLLMSGNTWAAVIKGLYEAQRVVANQGDEERGKALRDGLSEVLVRITGNENAASDEGIRKAFNDPLTLVRQYRYERFEIQPGAWGLSIRMVFDPAAVDARLQANDLPLWGRERPASLVWLAVEDGRRRWVSTEDGGVYLQVLSDAAMRRGIPLLFPLLDLEERRSVAVSDVWGGFSDTVFQASQRYGTPSVVLIRLRQRTEGWEAHWTQQAFGEVRAWETHGDLEQTLNAGVNHLADDLARRFVIAGGVVTDVRLDVDAIHDLAGYGRLMAYLRGLSPILALRVMSLSDKRLQLSARVRGGAAALEPVIGLDTVLSPVADVANADASDGTLRYRLEAR